MKIAKFLSAVLASAIVLTSAIIPANAAESLIDDGTVIIGLSDCDWKLGMWGKSDDAQDFKALNGIVAVTGNGEYTVKLDLSTGYTKEGWEDDETGDLRVLTDANSISAAGLQAKGAQFEGAIFNITAVRFDGVATELKGASYTAPEDGGYRTNIYNEWGAFDAATGLTTDASTATPKLIDPTTVGVWTVMEVDFTVSGMSGAPAPETGAAPTTGTAPETGTTPPDTKGEPANPDTGVEGIAAVAGHAIIATGAIIVSKKRK